jgi:two-component system, OmpR family, sensor kinase
MHALVSGIALASTLGILVSLVLGIAVVRRSLRPLRTMAAEVAAIEADGDLSRRVLLSGPPDEVGSLADSFDSMLGRLEEAFHKQRRFLAEASHELRTPLTVVRGQLEVLADELDARKLVHASDELERMSRIVDDLLLLAHLDEGMQLRREPVELELVLREALLRGMLLAPREIRVDAEPVVYARADPDRLLQVTSNLVTNAIKHTPENGHITLRSERVDGQAVIHVADDGCGIPPDELPHVFERFYRGASERASRPEGSGLGLAIAHSLVAAMDGTLEVRSSPARATTFTVRLPAA